MAGGTRSGLTKEQKERIHKEAVRVFNEQFRGRPSAQINFGRALGIQQSSVSAMLSGKYTPGQQKLTTLARLAGYSSLKEMIGPSHMARPAAQAGYQLIRELETAIDFYGETRWPPWVTAAVRAGYYGFEEASPLEWAKRLDELASKKKP